MADINLRAIAQEHSGDALNTWPDHISFHSRTIMRNFLWDEACLRCHLEEVASNKIQARIEQLEGQLRALYLLLLASDLPGGPQLGAVRSIGMMLVPDEFKSNVTLEEIREKLPVNVS